LILISLFGGGAWPRARIISVTRKIIKPAKAKEISKTQAITLWIFFYEGSFCKALYFAPPAFKGGVYMLRAVAYAGSSSHYLYM